MSSPLSPHLHLAVSFTTSSLVETSLESASSTSQNEYSSPVDSGHTLRNYQRHLLHQESEPPSTSATTMSHSRHSSVDASDTTSRAPTGTTPRNTSHSGTRAEDPDDSMNAVYKAIVKNLDFISRLADVLHSNP